MDHYHIRGRRTLQGCIVPHGAKNAALPIMAASVLTGAETVLENCPDISDVRSMCEILESIGCRTGRDGRGIYINTKNARGDEIPQRLMGGMRSSLFLLGPLLVRFGNVILNRPGGCSIGQRPVDIHLEVLRSLGASVEEIGEAVHCRAEKLTGTQITLRFPSVGATENAMMAACGAAGETILRNAAREPEIVDLQNYLTACGAQITGAGTGTIRILPARLSGCTYSILPDRIEAGTLLAAVAAAGGRIRLQGIRPELLTAVLSRFTATGCRFDQGVDFLEMQAPDRLRAVNIRTGPYPGFPTDMQSPFLGAAACAEGLSVIEETVFENRFRIAEELNKMGADIRVAGRYARVRGAGMLTGAQVDAPDLRGGAGLVVAALGALGESVVSGISHIERGYEDLPGMLQKLGADIEAV